jgi:hypothetical protein
VRQEKREDLGHGLLRPDAGQRVEGVALHEGDRAPDQARELVDATWTLHAKLAEHDGGGDLLLDRRILEEGDDAVGVAHG